MKNIKFYDMPNINCWIINLKPFDDGTSDAEIQRFQDECLEENIFGIGWWTEYFNKNPKLVLDEETKKEYMAVCESSARDAVEKMSFIKYGDLVITRLRNGHIYIGKVIKTAFHDSSLFKDKNSKILSWICGVEKWFDLIDKSLIPSEISGRFSQRQQTTITRIADYKQRMLMIAMYETAYKGKTDVPKIILNENNFARALNYLDLEDLVCAYIYNKHYEDGYMPLPSSGKVNRLKYEFTFISNKTNKKPITCQVKNQNSEPINVKNYENDKNIYEKIYLFSGNNNFINKDYCKDNIEIIDNKNLFNVLKCGNLKFMYKKLSRYHSFCDNINLNEIQNFLKNWKCKKMFKGSQNNFKCYKVWKYEKEEIKKIEEIERIFFGYNGFYITDEFNSFIIEWQDDNTEAIKEQLKKDLELR